MRGAVRMYKVIIAEDELLVRLGLSASVPWTELNMDVVAVVSNGKKAWESYINFKPDIVITDIRMPHMDGVELIDNIRAADNNCKIIVVSCVEDFNILHKTLKLGISGYLLKATMTSDEIVSLLTKIKEELDGWQKVPDSSVAVKNKSYYNILSSLIIKKDITTSEFIEECTSIGIIPPSVGTLVICQAVNNPLKPTLEKPIMRILYERFEILGTKEIFQFSNKSLIYIFLENQHSFNCEIILSTFNEIYKYISEIFNIKVRGIALQLEILNLNKDNSNLGKQIIASEYVLNNTYFYPKKFYFLPKCIEDNKKMIKSYICKIKNNPVCWGFCDLEKKQLLYKLLSHLEGSFSISQSKFLSIFEKIYTLIFNKHPDCKWEQAQTLEEAFKQFCRDLPYYDEHPIYGKQILVTLEYICKNYNKNILLSDMAEMINLSTNYYAILFKYTLDVSFSEFLTSLRLQHARKLLQNTRLSIKQIAGICGFSDVTYFIRFFKRKLGTPPGKWRTDLNLKN
jgi:two-component system response regulator YesN